VGSRTVLKAVARRENTSYCRKSNPGRIASSLVTILTGILWLLGMTVINEKYIRKEDKEIKFSECLLARTSEWLIFLPSIYEFKVQSFKL
jgi:hypothetical protein